MKSIWLIEREYQSFVYGANGTLFSKPMKVQGQEGLVWMRFR